MGLIGNVLNVLFGSGGNVIRETAEVFRENSEAGAIRDSDIQQAALDAFRAEFVAAHDRPFNQFMDGLNRLPRPALALSTLGLFVAAMVNPQWFAARMEGVALVPEPLWWLMGVVVSFYFGARHQFKGQEFQRALAVSLSHVSGQPRRDAKRLSPPSVFKPIRPVGANSRIDTTDNAALADWKDTQRGW